MSYFVNIVYKNKQKNKKTWFISREFESDIT